MPGTRRREEEAYRILQRRANEIARLIVATDYPAVDVAIEIRKLKEYVEAEFPGKRRLFERIYESRFKRLWDQFRADTDEPLPEWD